MRIWPRQKQTDETRLKAEAEANRLREELERLRRRLLDDTLKEASQNDG